MGVGQEAKPCSWMPENVPVSQVKIHLPCIHTKQLEKRRECERACHAAMLLIEGVTSAVEPTCRHTSAAEGGAGRVVVGMSGVLSHRRFWKEVGVHHMATPHRGIKYMLSH